MRRIAVAICIAVVASGFSASSGHAIAQEVQRIHMVQPGETLVEIELFYNVEAQALATENNVGSSALLNLKQDLAVPGIYVSDPLSFTTSPFVYVVQRGDTLFRIASRYGISMGDLAAINNVGDLNTIYVGQSLIVAGTPMGIGLPASSIPSEDVPVPTVQEGKQILVVLSQQRVYAYENGVLIRQFIVSTGLPATPTIQGDYAIYLKLDRQRMVGPGYDLPDVPWVMYFYQGYSLHGTYWHSNFGRPMSHGCVNMRTPEAEWLYNWAPVGTSVQVTY